MAQPVLFSVLLLVSAAFGAADAEPADQQLLAAFRFRTAHAAFKADAGAECVALSFQHREVFAMMERLVRGNVTAVPGDWRKNATARKMESSDAAAAAPSAAAAAADKVARANATAGRRLTLRECVDTDNGALDS